MTNADPPFFRLGTIGAKASLITILILMFLSPGLALSVFMGIVYAVVPLSIWKRERNLRWRVPVGVTLGLGYSWMLLGVGLELTSGPHNAYSYFPGAITIFFSLTAGILFLPLAAMGSLTTLSQRIRSRQETSRKDPGAVDRDQEPDR